MLNKKTLVVFSLILAIVYHFVFYFTSYGPSFNPMLDILNSLLALASSLILLFVYFGTRWREDIKGSSIVRIFDIMIVWILVCYLRSLVSISGSHDLNSFLFGNITGLSLFPPLFFIVGINVIYFSLVNKILFFYSLFAYVISMVFLSYFELQFFLLLPIFYIIVTYPLQSTKNRLLTFLISGTIIVTSLTNRAGAIRIIFSYFSLVIYYFILNFRIGKKLLNLIVFCILMSPIYFIYLGINGKNIFQMMSSDSSEGYGQKNLTADTRTFLYVEVFQDLKINKAFPFGKGLNAGYASEEFDTFNRTAAEVGFLQILLKTGILGFLLYMILLISAIFKSLSKSNSLFMKYLGLILFFYVLMFFIENILAFNLFNIIIWIVVGMCHSEKLRSLNDDELRELLSGGNTVDALE